jgi:hypothetical protein
VKKINRLAGSRETRRTAQRSFSIMIVAKQRHLSAPALDRSEFYLRQARESLRLAHAVHDDRRQAFIELAAAWQRLADFSDRSDGFDTKLQ